MDQKWIILELVAGWILTWGLVPHVLAQRQKAPPALFAWVFAILFIPILGGIIYLLFGIDRMHRRRLRRVQDFRKHGICGSLGEANSASTTTMIFPELERINGMCASTGNAVRLLASGEDFFDAMVEAIHRARHHVHVEFYIWAMDSAGTLLRDALVAAAQRGVQVRVLLDEIGSLTTFRRFFAPLTRAGGRMAWFGTFSPRRGSFHLNFRNHKKLLVCDGLSAITGGRNIAQEYWKDTEKGKCYQDLALEIEGPCVQDLAWQFAQDWYFSTDEILREPEYFPAQTVQGSVSAQIIAGGPDNDLNEVQMSLLSVVQRAQQRIWLMTPYFVPEAPLLAALQLAALRGVQVRILVPQRCDHFYLTAVTRSFYEDLLPYGIDVQEYQSTMLHAKAAVIDDQHLMVGSANLDVRSLRINFELNLLLNCPKVTADLAALFEAHVLQSHEVVWELFQQRSFWQRLAETLLRPLAPLM